MFIENRKPQVKIVTNPLKLWLLKAVTNVFPNSGWRDVSSSNLNKSERSKLVFIKVGKRKYMYVSPFTKSHWTEQEGGTYSPLFKATIMYLDRLDDWFVKKNWSFGTVEHGLSSTDSKKNRIDKIKRGSNKKRFTDMINHELALEHELVRTSNDKFMELFQSDFGIDGAFKIRKDAIPEPGHEPIKTDVELHHLETPNAPPIMSTEWIDNNTFRRRNE